MTFQPPTALPQSYGTSIVRVRIDVLDSVPADGVGWHVSEPVNPSAAVLAAIGSLFRPHRASLGHSRSAEPEAVCQALVASTTT